MKIEEQRLPFTARFGLQTPSDRKEPLSDQTERRLHIILRLRGDERRISVQLPGKGVVFLTRHEWDQPTQRTLGNTYGAALVNRTVAEWRDKYIGAYLAQAEAHAEALKQYEAEQVSFITDPAPTLDSVIFQAQRGRSPWLKSTGMAGGFATGVEWVYEPAGAADPERMVKGIDVNQAVATYIVELKEVGRKDNRGRLVKPSKLILDRFRITQGLLARYQPTPMSIRDITPRWADGFHTWMQSQPTNSSRPRDVRISQGLATRHVRRLAEMVGWLHRQKGLLPTNPLSGMSWAGYDPKEVTWLNNEQLAALENLECAGPLSVVRWWFLLMCYTGMDYPDARAYVANPAAYETATPEGVIIQGKRLKPPCVSYTIPKLQKVEQLLALHPVGPTGPNGPYQYQPQKMNNYVRDVLAPLIGFDDHLTIKIARKTAAFIFHEGGLTVSQVSRVLGHTRVEMTEKHYFRTSAQTVLSGMKSTGITGKL